MTKGKFFLLLIAALSLFGAGFKVGSMKVQGEFDASEKVWLKKVADGEKELREANEKNRLREQELLIKVRLAEENAQAAWRNYETATIGVGDATNKLLNAIKSTSTSGQQLSESSFAACQRQQERLSIALGECGAEVRELVRASDKQELERRTCRDGWSE